MIQPFFRRLKQEIHKVLNDHQLYAYDFEFLSFLDSLDLNIKLTSKDMWHFWHFEYIQELDT